MKYGWVKLRLHNVCDFQNGFAFKSKTYKTMGLPILRITNIQNQELDLDNLVYFDADDYKEDFTKYKVLKGDLVIAMSGATTGKLGINTSNTVFYLNQRVGKFIPKKELDKSYLYHFLSTRVEDNLKISAGAAQPNLSTEQIKSFVIPTPPLPEQKRIVKILDEAFAAIDKAKANAEKNLANSRELFDVHLDAAFESSNDGWKVKRLEELLEEQPKNGWSPPAKNHVEIGTPVLTLSAVTGFIFKPYSIKHTNADVKAEAAYWVKNGDLLITRSNTPELVGHVAICIGLIDKTIYPDLMMKINPKKSLLSVEFLYHQLKSQKLRNAIMASAHGANPTMKKINKQDVQALKIRYPSLNTQQTIVQKLDALSSETKKLEALYQKKLSVLDDLKQSILNKAFAGEL